MSSLNRIAILDGFWQDNPQDDVKLLKTIVENVDFYESTTPDQVAEHAKGAQMIVVNKVKIGVAEMDALPELKYVGVAATGYNVVDLTEARKRGIVVTNVPAYSTDSVAQTVFAFILEHAMHVAAHSEAIRNGAWERCPHFTFKLTPLQELANKTIGIVGLGRIGQAVAKIANAFGMNVLANSRSLKDDLPEYIQQVELDTLLKNADIVTLHCPLTDKTNKLIDAKKLALMKPTAILVNTSRGPVVDEQALADALNNQVIAGAGIDTLSVEPPTNGNPLIKAKNCLVTPHLAWATAEAKARLVSVIVDNIRAFIAGSPINVVN
ncbi:MAG: D-2-hydroxyacid dehydrogenase [Lentisphaerae bacterium]|jgi:glycerate dehydrogenase|nr:D-2-hydroxyacid dehydrogenase [Lentisphaerota bacterium]